jgi:hypothetical protein
MTCDPEPLTGCGGARRNIGGGKSAATVCDGEVYRRTINGYT